MTHSKKLRLTLERSVPHVSYGEAEKEYIQLDESLGDKFPCCNGDISFKVKSKTINIFYINMRRTEQANHS